MKVDEMIESIEVVKVGRVEKFVMPFDSVPPSLVVVSREGLVKLLEEKCAEITQLKYEIGVFVKQPNTPLTFEQLKQRVGKPVWKTSALRSHGCWDILLAVREQWLPDGKCEKRLLFSGNSCEVWFYDPATSDTPTLCYDREV